MHYFVLFLCLLSACVKCYQVYLLNTKMHFSTILLLVLALISNSDKSTKILKYRETYKQEEFVTRLITQFYQTLHYQVVL